MPGKFQHAPNNAKFHPHVSNNGAMMPAHQSEGSPGFVNEWMGWRRLNSKTSVPTVISQGMEVDFDLITYGPITTMYIELTLRENNTGLSRFNVYNLFERIEFEHDGQLFRVVYPDEAFIRRMLHRNQLDHERKRILEGLQENFTPDTSVIVQNSSRTFYLELDVFDGSQADVRSLKSGFLIKFYFNSLANIIMGGSSTNISLTQMNLILKHILAPKFNNMYDRTFRYINYVRNIQPITLQPSTQYDIKLNTFDGLSSYIFFIIRPSGASTNGDNWIAYNGNISNFELRDETNNIIAIANTPLFNRYIVSQGFEGDFLNQPNNNVYVMPFGIAPGLAEDGIFTGGMRFTTNEFLHFETSSALVAGNYEIAIWNAEYNWFVLTRDGDLKFTR